MEKRTSTPALLRGLPLAVVATAAVVGLPLLAVSLLRYSGAVDSMLLLLGVAMALSVTVSHLGSVLWATRPGEGDAVFGDLMLWGWVRRRRQERRIASAARMLEPRSRPALQRGDRRALSRHARLLERLASSLEARDPYTQNHSRRVARHAAAIAKRMGLPAEEVARIRTAGTLHDVGKLETPREIMNKPEGLTDEEFAVIKEHPVTGARMIAELGDEDLTRMVRHHHERLDGKGYPDGLRGDEIPVGARILAVADTFDAITSRRPYRPARPHRRALKVLAAEAGEQLDPDAVRAFRAYYSGLRSVAFWSFFLNGPRLLPSLLGDLRSGGLAVAAKATTATAVTVAAAGVAGQALPVQPPAIAAQKAGAAAAQVPASADAPAFQAVADRALVNSFGDDAAEAARYSAANPAPEATTDHAGDDASSPTVAAPTDSFTATGANGRDEAELVSQSSGSGEKGSSPTVKTGAGAIGIRRGGGSRGKRDGGSGPPAAIQLPDRAQAPDRVPPVSGSLPPQAQGPPSTRPGNSGSSGSAARSPQAEAARRS